MNDETTASQPMQELVRDLYNFEGGRHFALRLEKMLASQPKVYICPDNECQWEWEQQGVGTTPPLCGCCAKQMVIKAAGQADSQPKSIGDDAQFIALLREYTHVSEMIRGHAKRPWADLVSYIDSRAPAAQASATIQAAPTDEDVAGICVSVRPDDYQDDNKHTDYLRYDGAVVRAYLKGTFDATIQAAPGTAVTSNGMIYHDVEETYHQAENYEALNMWLDDKGVPRADSKGAVFSGVGRVTALLAATIQEPVMVAEPVENCPVCEEGTLVACNFHWCNKCGVEVGTTSDAKRNVEIMKLAAPMVAEPVAAQFKMPGETWEACSIDEEDAMRARGYKFRHLYTHPAPMVADPAGAAFDREEFIQQVSVSIAEMDRDSPEGQPEMMLVTPDELQNTMRSVFDRFDGAATVKAVPSEALEPKDDFARGVIAALGVMTAHGHPHGSTYHDEIVHSVGEASIYAVAEDEDYEWAGLDPAKKPSSNFAAPLADNTGGGE